MSVSKEFSRGMSAYGEAHKVIFKYKLAHYLLIPAVITVLYCGLYFFLAAHFAGRMSDEADSYPWWLSWMGAITHWFVKAVYWVAAVGFFFVSLKYVVQVILAPILSNLSVAVEKRVLGQETPEITWKEALQDMGRSLRLSIRNSVIEIAGCLAMNFVPGIGQLGAVALSSYFYGFGYMDYVLERKRMNIPQAVAFVRQHKGLAMGLGFVMYLLMLIPVVGWAIAPTYATVAATLETLRIMRETGMSPDSIGASGQSIPVTR